ncbi:cyanophycinase [Runella slithyformis]|uniref:Cyanophycinase n=1 Tax=Runella slithyformis (strain ATCC 29530 / DSM 19594 / LMG 11500 / NCIMB 11436 / LSU 4) TaxID=761193 RepID=A0A7U3ZNY0_RUNSL|nr:cyanophycinase [Runella slithyformis]AEI50603.1 cyanophycinase [Runella slithyformis DSM 19594]
MIPKGTILIIGGAEDRGDGEKDIQRQNKNFEHFEILKELLPSKHTKGRIELITTASSVPEEMKKMYMEAYKKIGFSDIGFIDIKDKKEARSPEYRERIHNAHAVFFSGGDQFALTGILGGTEVVDAIRDKYMHDREFVVAGTSAGAMALPKMMILEGGVNEAIIKGDLRVTSGLGVFDTCIIDTHFIKRGRFGRLANAIVMNPESLGIGLGEDTVFIIKKGCEAECRGSGMIVIIDGNAIEQTNITEIEEGMPIFVENLKVHLLAKGSRFSIKERKMVYQTKKEKEQQT